MTHTQRTDAPLPMDGSVRQARDLGQHPHPQRPEVLRDPLLVLQPRSAMLIRGAGRRTPFDAPRVSSAGPKTGGSVPGPTRP